MVNRMSVTILCPNLNCGRTVVATESMRGKVVRCAHCNQPFVVPIQRAASEADNDAKKKSPVKKP